MSHHIGDSRLLTFTIPLTRLNGRLYWRFTQSKKNCAFFEFGRLMIGLPRGGSRVGVSAVIALLAAFALAALAPQIAAGDESVLRSDAPLDNLDKIVHAQATWDPGFARTNDVSTDEALVRNANSDARATASERTPESSTAAPSQRGLSGKFWGLLAVGLGGLIVAGSLLAWRRSARAEHDPLPMHF